MMADRHRHDERSIGPATERVANHESMVRGGGRSVPTVAGGRFDLDRRRTVQYPRVGGSTGMNR